MKILSNKKYEQLQQCITDLKMDYTDAKDQMKIYDGQVEYLQESIKGYQQQEQKLWNTVHDLQKEVKRLKQLCTRNKVNYKKEENDGRKTKKVLHKK